MITKETSEFERTVRSMAQSQASLTRSMAVEWFGGSQENGIAEIRAIADSAVYLLYAIGVASRMDIFDDTTVVAGVNMKALRQIGFFLHSERPSEQWPLPSLDELIVGGPDTDGEVAP